MSAIWGAISFSNKGLSKEKAEKMKSAFEKYRIDSTEEYSSQEIILGCGLQYFTKESKYEKLPFVEEKDEIYFTADAVVDNRLELLKELNLEKEVRIVPDGEILYKAYRKWGREGLDKLAGSYVFVYYDKKERTISVVSDAAGTRCLYYRYEDGVFQFASAIEALTKKGEKKKINERWVTDFLALDNLVGITECEETMYQGIYKVAPANILKITDKGVEKERYWNPSPEKLKLTSDEEYKKRFIKVFGDAVRCLLRAEKTAMLLSGGLDSSSIACFAAPELKKRGETLYTFTSVPEKGYVSDKSAYNVTDESVKVKKTAEFLGNVECRFVNSEGKDAWSEHYEMEKGLEIPYKSAQNLQWLIDGMKESYRLGARIMLEGGYGNVTISYGSPVVYLNTLLSKGKFISFIKEIQCFSKRYGWSRKLKYKAAISTVKDYYFSEFKLKEKKEESLGKAYIREEKVKEFDLYNRIGNMNKKRRREKKKAAGNRKVMLDNIQLSHKGEMNTKESLMTGVLFRDPCMDKRVIEFCMSLPIEQYCYHGVPRRLVREYLEGIVPEHITKTEDFGCQGADMLYKVKKNWGKIGNEIKDVYRHNRQNEIVNVEAALVDLEEFEKDILKQKSFDFVRLFYTAILLESMEKEKFD